MCIASSMAASTFCSSSFVRWLMLEVVAVIVSLVLYSSHSLVEADVVVRAGLGAGGSDEFDLSSSAINVLENLKEEEQGSAGPLPYSDPDCFIEEYAAFIGGFYETEDFDRQKARAIIAQYLTPVGVKEAVAKMLFLSMRELVPILALESVSSTTFDQFIAAVNERCDGSFVWARRQLGTAEEQGQQVLEEAGSGEDFSAASDLLESLSSASVDSRLKRALGVLMNSLSLQNEGAKADGGLKASDESKEKNENKYSGRRQLGSSSSSSSTIRDDVQDATIGMVDNDVVVEQQQRQLRKEEEVVGKSGKEEERSLRVSEGEESTTTSMLFSVKSLRQLAPSVSSSSSSITSSAYPFRRGSSSSGSEVKQEEQVMEEVGEQVLRDVQQLLDTLSIDSLQSLYNYVRASGDNGLQNMLDSAFGSDFDINQLSFESLAGLPIVANFPLTIVTERGLRNNCGFLSSVDKKCFIIEYAGFLGSTWETEDFDRQKAAFLISQFLTTQQMLDSMASLMCLTADFVMPELAGDSSVTPEAIIAFMNTVAVDCAV